ncbi:integral membrane sensor signal transduction histidine kinase [[Leptolyngbya] sp. PCC 7376]|uniref:sensor histidine kinase n=1 Tax=[Leptolyngbya] sp. PCC 7376 TaxID=111781 RepID=UPI00029F2815|nr:ATP-binding protein [[Leptolyngbya] sp. PCC 7376]AFY37641.1 integral membrane sensor signal transduction histidine kinase [[Leptolyngbya] sp. PCC 7376]
MSLPPNNRDVVAGYLDANPAIAGFITSQETDKIDKSPQNFQLARYFSMTSFVVLLVAAGLLSWIYQSRAKQDLKQFGEAANVEITKTLYQANEEDIITFIEAATSLSDTELLIDPVSQKIAQDLDFYLNALDITKIKFFEASGRTIFSTDSTQVGQDKAKYEGFQKAIKGEVFSSLKNHDPLLHLAGWNNQDKVLHSSYIPLYASPSGNADNTIINDQGKIIGVLEIYRDVTPHAQAIARSQARISTSIAVSFIFLYAGLFLIIRRADKIIQNQQDKIQTARDNFQDQAAQLEETLDELNTTQAQLILQEKMFGLSQMVAGLAHELNNPIAFVSGNINYAGGYIEDLFDLLNLYEKHVSELPPSIEAKQEEMDLEFIIDDLPKCMKSMREGTVRIQNIVASLRVFSRLGEAKIKRVSLKENITSIWNLLNYRLQSLGIELSEHYGDLPKVECDAAEINQVFFHLLSNAIDALEIFDNPNKYIHIRGKVVSENMVEISVTNNGLPLPDRIKKHMFDPFFTTKKVGKGTGMGLTVSYQIIQNHGGTLSVESTSEETTLIVRLPITWQEKKNKP